MVVVYIEKERVIAFFVVSIQFDGGGRFYMAVVLNGALLGSSTFMPFGTKVRSVRVPSSRIFFPLS